MNSIRVRPCSLSSPQRRVTHIVFSRLEGEAGTKLPSGLRGECGVPRLPKPWPVGKSKRTGARAVLVAVEQIWDDGNPACALLAVVYALAVEAVQAIACEMCRVKRGKGWLFTIP